MEDTCVAEPPLSSSDPSCDDRVSNTLFVTKVTSNCMAASGRPCDPRDFKKSRAYQFKTLDQNAFQLDQKMAQEKSTVVLDRSILTPITDGDQLNDIKMVTSNVEYDVIVSEDAVIDLAIDNSVDVQCMPELADMAMDVEVGKKEESIMKEDRTEINVVVVENQPETEDRKENNVIIVVEEDRTEAKEQRKEDIAIIIEDKMEAEEQDKEDNLIIAEDKMEAEEDRNDENVMVNEDKIKAEDKNENTVEEDKTKEDKVIVEATMEDDAAKEKGKDKMEVDDVKEKDDKMEVEVPTKEQSKVENCMDSAKVDSRKLPISNTTAVDYLPLVVSNVRVKTESFHFNPEPIDDDLALPSCNELSNQVHFLRDIENLNDCVDVQLPISRVLNKPLIPSCSAFRSSVLSNVTSTVKSGSSLSISGKRSTKNMKSVTKSPRKTSSPCKVVDKTPEKSVSKKSSTPKKSSVSSSDGEKTATAPVTAKDAKQKPVVEVVKKYSTRRTARLDESKQVECEIQGKSTSSVQEKTPVKDIKLSPNKHTNLQSSRLKEKSKSKPPQLTIKTSKQSKSPSKTPAKSPSKTMQTRTTTSRQSERFKTSPHTPTPATPHNTRSHTKATASSSDPIPAWITWKCCLCSRGSSQDHLGFLYGPYKSQTDDCLSVGSKRTRDDADNESSDEKQVVPELWVHEGCACWSPGVCLVGSELHGLAEAVKNAKDMECVGCHQPGATISCSNRGCKASFHYPCAIRAGCSLLPDQLLLLCHTHNTQEKTV